jgi:hypothetical protein
LADLSRLCVASLARLLYLHPIGSTAVSGMPYGFSPGSSLRGYSGAARGCPHPLRNE